MPEEDGGRDCRTPRVHRAHPQTNPCVPPLGSEVVLCPGALQFQDHHFMKLQEEGVEVRLIQESPEALRVFWAETHFVLGTDVPEGLLEQTRTEAAGGWEEAGGPSPAGAGLHSPYAGGAAVRTCRPTGAARGRSCASAGIC